MNRRDLLLSLPAVAASPWSLAAPSEPGVQKTEILFGQTADLTASRAAITKAYSEGAGLHFAEINAAGGIGGRRLRVLQLPGVARFVCFNGQPAALPQHDLNALREGLSHNLQAEQHPYLTVGRRVKVVYGPLSGAQGILQRWKNNCRLVISIDAIMRSVALEIDEADVVPLF